MFDIEAIKERHEAWTIDRVAYAYPSSEDIATLLSALTAAEARAESAEAKLAEALLNPVSAAPSPAPDEVERVARALLREEIESYRESDVLLDEHIQWWKDGNDNLESCVHYSSIGLAMRRARAAISALRPAPKLSEDEAVVERLADVIADAMNMNRAGRLEHEAALAVLSTLAGKE